MSEHAQMNRGDLRQKGVESDETGNAAKREFGTTLLLREKKHDAWDFSSLETLLQDLRYGLRQLRRNPGFTTVAVLTLALGIGANTAIFTLINAVALRTLPVRDPGHLVLLKWTARSWPKLQGSYFYSGCPGAVVSSTSVNPGGCSFSYPVFDQIQRSQTGFAGAFAFTGSYEFDTSFREQVGRASFQFVSGSFFPVLDERTMIGRLLEPGDDVAGAAPVLVLSHGYWQNHFGGEPSVVGKGLLVNGVPFTIAGVSPSDFLGLETGIPVDGWIPLSCQPRVFPYFPKKSDTAGIWLDIGGRLKPDVPLSRAQSAINLIFAQTTTSGPGAIFKPGDAPRVDLLSMSHGLATLRQRFSQPLSLLTAAGAIILLIACANLASLMLARATTRQREMAARLALGASRLRIMRQLFTENILLAAAGGMVGMLLAYWSANSLVSFLSSNFYTRLEISTRPDLGILGFMMAVSVLAAILFGFAPVVFGSCVDVISALKNAGRDSSVRTYAGRGRPRFANILVVAQVALSVVVLVGAGLLIRTLTNLETLNVGFDKRNLLLFNVDTTQSGLKAPQLPMLSQTLQDRFASLPGVASVSYSMFSLLSGANMATEVFFQGAQGEQKASVDQLAVGPGFFHTMHIPVLAGRTFAPLDFGSRIKPQPVIVNQTLVRRYFGKENPLGHRLGGSPESPDWEIVGVVRDAKYSALREPINPTIYLPFRPSIGGPAFEIRTERDPKALISLVRSAVKNINKRLLLNDITTQIEQIDKALYQERLVAMLSSTFGLLALVLVGVGLYGLLAYQVAHRTHEIGVRMALGAQKSDVLRMIVGQGLWLVLIGAVIGVAGALALTRFLSSFLYGVKPTDPLTFISVSLILAAVAFAACYIPAHRAANVDPMVALRYE